MVEFRTITNFSVSILLSTFLLTIGYCCVRKIWNSLALRHSYGQIGTPKGHWFLGHVNVYKQVEPQMLEHVRRIKLFPKLQCIWIGFLALLSIYHPSICGSLLETEEPKTTLLKRFMKPWIGDGLLVSQGKKWKRNRRLLTPAFHFEILKNYLLIFKQTVSEMIEKWKEKENGKVEAFEDVSLMTLDSILKCAMSYNSNCQYTGKENPYIKAVYDLSSIVLERFNQPWLFTDFAFSLSDCGRRFRKAVNVAHEQTAKIIKARKEILETNDKTKKTRKNFDFLDILLLAKDSNGVGLSESEIRDEVDTFLFEGHDTTASGISWALYNFATYQEEQEKCRSEVLDILRNKNEIDMEDVSKLKYLTMFIKESMRLYPPVPVIARELSKSMKFTKDMKDDQFNVSPIPMKKSSQTLPKNTLLDVYIFGTHRHPNIWKDAEKFDPSRFTTENIAKRPTYSYIPFSAGPRNCIGQNFAMLEMKVALALVLKKFKIFVDENFPKPEMASYLILKSTNGIHLMLKPL